MDIKYKIYGISMFLILTVTFTLMSFITQYGTMAIQMFPEIFRQYNWETLPLLESRMMRDTIYPLIPINIAIIHGLMVTSIIYLVILMIYIWDGGS